MINNKFCVLCCLFSEQQQNNRHGDNAHFGIKCQICLTDYVAVYLQPCRHFILCLSCATTLLRQCVLDVQLRCPLCRSNVTRVEFPYLPAHVDTGKRIHYTHLFYNYMYHALFFIISAMIEEYYGFLLQYCFISITNLSIY